jgi:hypothetical protein
MLDVGMDVPRYLIKILRQVIHEMGEFVVLLSLAE